MTYIAITPRLIVVAVPVVGTHGGGGVINQGRKVLQRTEDVELSKAGGRRCVGLKKLGEAERWKVLVGSRAAASEREGACFSRKSG